MTTLSHQMSRLSPIADNMANFAQELQTKDIIVDKLLYWFAASTDHQKLTPDNSRSPPGECWCFAGTEGHSVVFLSHCIKVTHVTLGQITNQQSITGEVNSAPKREWRKRTQAASTWGASSMTMTAPPPIPSSFTMYPKTTLAT
ncbi:klaroid protein-like [Spinachia spinachia]